MPAHFIRHSMPICTDVGVYKAMNRLHAIWSEGTFAALKREHNLKRARKRGLNHMSGEPPIGVGIESKTSRKGARTTPLFV